MTKAWLRDLEERVHQTAARLQELREDNERLSSENQQLQETCSEADTTRMGLEKELAEVNSKLEQAHEEGQQQQTVVAELRARVEELEQQGGVDGAAEAWTSEREEIRQRVGTLVDHLESLLAE